MFFEKKMPRWFLDGIVYLGLVMSGLVFLDYIGNEIAGRITGVFWKNSEQAASVLCMFALIGIYAYCMCEDKMQSIIFGFCAGMNFFALLLNHNIFGNWLMIGIFFAIPLLLRPTAELIKRDMQLFFLYVFGLCNMSLLTNYTYIFRKEVSYQLEQSVYMEMVFALLGLIFFHYWDRLPQDVELKKISMVRLQKRFKTVFIGWLGSFFIVLLGGNTWQELESKGMSGFIRNEAILLLNELAERKSFLFQWVQRLGIGMTVLLLAGLCIVTKRIAKKQHQDKRITNLLLLAVAVFEIELLVWDVSMVAIVWNIGILVLALLIKEDKKDVSIRSQENEKETKRRDDFDSTVICLSDTTSVCK